MKQVIFLELSFFAYVYNSEWRFTLHLRLHMSSPRRASHDGESKARSRTLGLFSYFCLASSFEVLFIAKHNVVTLREATDGIEDWKGRDCVALAYNVTFLLLHHHRHDPFQYCQCWVEIEFSSISFRFNHEFQLNLE